MEANNYIYVLVSIVLIIVAIFFLIPINSYLRSRFRKQDVNKDSHYKKPVSVIIAALNEENCVKKKMDFFLAESGFIEGSEIIVISAGSSDGTNEVLKSYEHHPSLKTIVLTEHITKPQALNIAVKSAKNELLVFSDCRQKIAAGALAELVSYFNDDNIGAVNSTISGTIENENNSWFRKVMNWVYLNDSTSGSSINLHGALYAIRKKAYRPFPEDILADDLYASVSVIGQGMRLVQSDEVKVYDIQFENYYSKTRLERLVRGLLIYMFRHWSEVRKMPFIYRIRFIAYKYLKLLLPFVLLSFGVVLVWSAVPMTSKVYSISVMSGLLLVLIIPKLRNLLLFVIRFNWYFLSATFGYVFLNKREVSWT